MKGTSEPGPLTADEGSCQPQRVEFIERGETVLRRFRTLFIVTFALVGLRALLLLSHVATGYPELGAPFRSPVLGTLELISGLLYHAVGWSFLRWQYLGHAELRVVADSHVRSPVWVVCSWLVPGASLFVPYRAMKELYRRIGGGTTTPVGRGSTRIFSRWWLLFWAHVIVGTLPGWLTGVHGASPSQMNVELFHGLMIGAELLTLYAIRAAQQMVQLVISARRATVASPEPWPVSPKADAPSAISS